MRVENEYWYVIGCPERNAYMACRGDVLCGYTDTGSVDCASRYESRKHANTILTTSPGVVKYLERRNGLGFRVCRVNRRTYVV